MFPIYLTNKPGNYRDSSKYLFEKNEKGTILFDYAGEKQAKLFRLYMKHKWL